MTHEDFEKAQKLEEEIQDLIKTMDSLKYAFELNDYKGSKIKNFFIERIFGKTRFGIHHDRGGANFNFDFKFDRETAIVLLEHYQERIKKKQKEFDNLGE